MKVLKLQKLIFAAALAAPFMLGGCVVAPAEPAYYAAPAPVTYGYAAPAYYAPAYVGPSVYIGGGGCCYGGGWRGRGGWHR